MSKGLLEGCSVHTAKVVLNLKENESERYNNIHIHFILMKFGLELKFKR